MSTNKSISYILSNNCIIVNLYKLHFLSSHFSFQPNKRVFNPPIFLPFQPNTHEKTRESKNEGENFPSGPSFLYPPILGGKWGRKSAE